MSVKLGQLFGFQMNLPESIGISMKTTCHILVRLRNHPDRVPKGQRRKVDLNVLLTGIVVSPWAADTTLSNVERIIREGGGSIPVRWSELTRFKQFLPDYQSPSYRLDEKCHT